MQNRHLLEYCMGIVCKLRNSLAGSRDKLIIVSFVVLCGCNQKLGNRAFLYTQGSPPIAPTLISPGSSGTRIVLQSNVRITGCFKPSCNTNTASWVVQGSGLGTITQTPTHFTFDSTMTVGETRVFSFTQTNLAGDVSPAATLTLTYNASFQLTPSSTLVNSGSGIATPKTSTNLSFVLTVFTTLPSLPNTEISSGTGYLLSSGALNPQ